MAAICKSTSVNVVRIYADMNILAFAKISIYQSRTLSPRLQMVLAAHCYGMSGNTFIAAWASRCGIHAHVNDNSMPHTAYSADNHIRRYQPHTWASRPWRWMIKSRTKRGLNYMGGDDEIHAQERLLSRQ